MNDEIEDMCSRLGIGPGDIQRTLDAYGKKEEKVSFALIYGGILKERFSEEADPEEAERNYKAGKVRCRVCGRVVKFSRKKQLVKHQTREDRAFHRAQARTAKSGPHFSPGKAYCVGSGSGVIDNLGKAQKKLIKIKRGTLGSRGRS